MHYHIFTNDLRYIDNDALNGPFVALFNLNPEQIRSKHASQNAIDFMISSLSMLPNMNIFEGTLSEFSKVLIKIVDPSKDRVTMHKDYTLYALKREDKLPKFIELIHTDRYLSDPGSLLKSDGSSYKSFGAFYKNAMRDIRKPKKITHEAVNLRSNLFKTIKPKGIGGRNFQKSKLKLFDSRDDMSIDSMMLSPYMTFGCYSIREMFWATTNDEFKKQMIWREFYQCIIMADPRSREYTFLDSRFEKFKWSFDQQEWKYFMKCDTGVLVVDAAMSQLLSTGFMNNRARMIWATYCVKYLQINPYDPKYGAVHIFSKYLIDCCTSQNKLNIEWIIGSLDLSGRRYAPKGVSIAGRKIDISNSKVIKKHNAYDYIRKWLPKYKDYTDKQLRDFDPRIDLEKRYQKWIDLCKKI